MNMLALNKVSLHTAALCYALLGWPVFPLRPREKRPATPNGVYDASIETWQITRWWTAAPPANIGLACGRIVVLDVDSEAVYPPTLMSSTGRGRHYFYKTDLDISNSVGKLAKGVDVRSKGGYVVLPPSIHPSGRQYLWLNQLEPAPLPVELFPESQPYPEPKTIEASSAYALAAFRQELDRVSRAVEGQRNHTLYSATFSLATLVGAGLLSQSEVESQLLSVALRIGLTETESRLTIASGMRKGMSQARKVK